MASWLLPADRTASNLLEFCFLFLHTSNVVSERSVSCYLSMFSCNGTGKARWILFQSSIFLFRCYELHYQFCDREFYVYYLYYSSFNNLTAKLVQTWNWCEIQTVNHGIGNLHQKKLTQHFLDLLLSRK